MITNFGAYVLFKLIKIIILNIILKQSAGNLNSIDIYNKQKEIFCILKEWLNLIIFNISHMIIPLIIRVFNHVNLNNRS